MAELYYEPQPHQLPQIRLLGPFGQPATSGRGKIVQLPGRHTEDTAVAFEDFRGIVLSDGH